MLLSKAFVLGPRREAWRACFGWLRPCEYWCSVRREWHLMPDGTSEHNSFGEQHLGQASIPKSSVARCKPHSKYQQAGQMLPIHRSCIDRIVPVRFFRLRLASFRKLQVQHGPLSGCHAGGESPQHCTRWVVKEDGCQPQVPHLSTDSNL